jgi:hypothetical protein
MGDPNAALGAIDDDLTVSWRRADAAVVAPPAPVTL